MRSEGVVLAGGRSSRMGTNKALLTFTGKSLVRLAFDKLVAALGDAGAVTVSGDFPGFPCARDEAGGGGPIEGIYSATRTTPFSTPVVVIPVDMPLLQVPDLRRLRDSLIDGRGAYRFSQFGEFELPFAFIFDSGVDRALRETRNSTDEPSRSLKRFKDRLTGLKLPVGRESDFKNVNTPGDWEEVRA